VFVVLPVALIISYLDHQKTPAIKRWFVKCLFSIVGKQLEVSGRRNVDPNRRYVVVSNYPSGYAGFALIGEFPHASLVAQAFLRRIPLLGQVLKRSGTVFVKPGMRGHGRKAIDLYVGEREDIPSLIILPEGKPTRDSKNHRFRRGFVYIQRMTSFDVLPVTLNGFFTLKPMGRLYADPDAELEMVIHPPLRLSFSVRRTKIGAIYVDIGRSRSLARGKCEVRFGRDVRRRIQSPEATN
jgi:1-acyl-sn-glycerol-3-phosphate acyltransferase